MYILAKFYGGQSQILQILREGDSRDSPKFVGEIIHAITALGICQARRFKKPDANTRIILLWQRETRSWEENPFPRWRQCLSSHFRRKLRTRWWAPFLSALPDRRRNDLSLFSLITFLRVSIVSNTPKYCTSLFGSVCCVRSKFQARFEYSVELGRAFSSSFLLRDDRYCCTPTVDLFSFNECYSALL